MEACNGFIVAAQAVHGRLERFKELLRDDGVLDPEALFEDRIDVVPDQGDPIVRVEVGQALEG